MCDKQTLNVDWIEFMREAQARGYEQGAKSVYSYLKGWFGHDHEYSKDMIMSGLEQALANALKFYPAQAKAEEEKAI